MPRRRGKPHRRSALAAAPAMKGSQRPSTVGDGATDAIVRRQSTPKQPEILPLTAATGFKRLGFALLAVLAVGAGVLVAAGYLISADAVRQQVVSEIRAVTGLNPILRGEATRLAVSLRQRQLRRRGARRRQAAGAHRRAADRAPALFSAAARPGRDRRRGAGAADHRDRPGAERQIQLVRPDRGAGAQPEAKDAQRRRGILRDAHRQRHRGGAQRRNTRSTRR